MRALRTCFLILLCFISLLSCAAKQLQPETIINFKGFSIKSPKSEGWQILRKSDSSALFAIPTIKDTNHTIRAYVDIIENGFFLNTNDLLAYVKSGLKKVPPRNKNAKLKSAVVKKLNGVECVLYDYTMEDHGVPNSLGMIFSIVGRHILCPHPDSPISFIVKIGYSQRFLSGEKPLATELECNSFLNSLTFSQLDVKASNLSLINAVKNYDVATARSLIAEGVDVNIKGSDKDWGKSALIEASIRGMNETVEMLLKSGADVNQTDNYGDTALMAAAWFGHADVARILILSGADVSATKPDGTTAHGMAMRKGNVDIAKMLIEAMMTGTISE